MENKHDPMKNRENINVPTAEFYGQIIDSLEDYSILTLDNEFNINSWSSGSTNIFGYEPVQTERSWVLLKFCVT
jgi:hypothetical protein